MAGEVSRVYPHHASSLTTGTPRRLYCINCAIAFVKSVHRSHEEKSWQASPAIEGRQASAKTVWANGVDL